MASVLKVNEIQSDTSLPLVFSIDNVERARIDTSGNVGIGAASPGARLHVSGSNPAGYIANYVENTASNGYARLDLQIGSIGANGLATVAYAPGIFMKIGPVANDTTTPLVFATNNDTERMRIDSSGNVGIGTQSPAVRLSLSTSTTGNVTAQQWTDGVTDTGYLGIRSGGGVGIWAGGFLAFGSGSGTFTERARITSGGSFLVGKTTTSAVADVGFEASAGGVGFFTSNQDNCIYVNRKGNDGTLVAFYQDTVLEGNISVSGTAVSYNGGHLARWSQLLNGQRDESIVKGTVLSNLDEMCEWFDAEGNPLPNEQLNRMKVSDVEGDTNVAGVFVNWDNDDQDNPYDMNIAMTGDMIIRIAQGVTVQKGDLLMSAGDGTAKPQGDDIVRSKTIAKVTSNHVTCTYDDGSYCVPCVLMAC